MLGHDQQEATLVGGLVGDKLAECLRTRKTRVDESSVIIEINQIVGPFRHLVIAVAPVEENVIKLTVESVKAVFQVPHIGIEEHQVLLVFFSLDAGESLQRLLPFDY